MFLEGVKALNDDLKRNIPKMTIRMTKTSKTKYSLLFNRAESVDYWIRPQYFFSAKMMMAI